MDNKNSLIFALSITIKPTIMKKLPLDSLAIDETRFRKHIIVLGNGFISIERATNRETAIELSQARYKRITLCSPDCEEQDFMNSTIEIEANQLN